MTASWPVSRAGTIRGSPPPPPSWECLCHLLSPLPEAALKTEPWGRDVVSSLPELGTWVNPVKSSRIHNQIRLRPLRKLLRLGRQCGDLLVSWLPKTSLCIPLLIKLATCQWEVERLFLPSVPASASRGCLQITPRKLSRRCEPI